MALIFFGLLFLVCIWLGRREYGRRMPEGEKVTVEDVAILLQALEISTEDLPVDDKNPGRAETEQEGTEYRETDRQDGGAREAAYLTYGQYREIREKLNTAKMDLPDYAERYEEEWAILKEDWYAAYRLLLAHLDTESEIWETTVFLMKTDAGTGQAYTESGGLENPYRYHSSAFEQNVLRQIGVYVKGKELLTVTRVLPEDHILKNVWIMEAADGALECFYHQIEFRAETACEARRESVADLTFRDGKLEAVEEKHEKVHGRLLRMTQEELEIEGCGVYPVAEEMEVYRLYGSLETMARSDLRIGYADTDFVIDEGKVCAGLVSAEEEADRIRVLLKNTVHNSNYHDEVRLVVDGETIQVKAADLQVGERRSYRCAALTDRVELYAGGIVKEDPAYRGVIECYRARDGMALVNELPLEEYLYAVVPGEMPASYPSEALKAQAVCARTYAYGAILHAGLPELGAHLDDTTSYQVYHNIKENAASTAAVKETKGVLLTWQGEPAQNYYYSTSCGVGTDADIWQSKGGDPAAYLQAIRLRKQGDDTARRDEEATKTPDALRDEETFRQFITSRGETDLEREEPWYRWTYTVEDMDVQAMLSRVQARYAANPESVLTKTEGDYYVSQPIGKIGRITELSVVRRGTGGVVSELLMETDTGTYKILSEYNIRCVLCDAVSEAVRQDGSTVIPQTLLPSGFFVMETGKEEGDVVGYTLTGGGYGHGVGMSQNGARALGSEGVSWRTILEYFFPGCTLGEIGDLRKTAAVVDGKGGL